MIDERAQLWHHLAAPGMVEKDTWRHGSERLQHKYQSAGRYGFGGYRLRHLRKAHAFECCPQECRKIIGEERSHAVRVGLPALAGELDATYAIPIIYVPLLMITHIVAFYLLLRPQSKA